ncbi:MAG: hypothetical protein ACK47C_03330 [Paracoccaceae bacterium]
MSSDNAVARPTGRPALWYWAAAGLGLAWNIFGAVQFVGSLSATPESLQAQGMTADQAAVMLGYPVWMTVVFAIGVFGGVLGCGLLLMRRSVAVPVFAVSLAGYIALYIGDIVHGVFAALGAPQVAVLSAVVLIAAALLWLSRRVRAQGILV